MNKGNQWHINSKTIIWLTNCIYFIFLQSLCYQIIFHYVHEVTAKPYLATHFVDSSHNRFTNAILDGRMQLPFQVPYITLNAAQFCDATHSAESTSQINRMHVILGARNKIWQIRNVWHLGLPARRVICLFGGSRNDCFGQYCFNEFPFFWVSDDLDLRMIGVDVF